MFVIVSIVNGKTKNYFEGLMDLGIFGYARKFTNIKKDALKYTTKTRAKSAIKKLRLDNCEIEEIGE